MNPSPTLRPFSDHIWTIDHPLSLMGAQVGTRCTVVRLPSSSLALISPVPIDDDLQEAIDALGEVSTIIAPNLFHHLFFDDALKRWPQAMGMAPPGFRDKVDVHREITDMGDRGTIEDALHWQRVQGMPAMRESVFVHPRDETLIATDLLFHFVDHPQWWLRQFMRLNGAYGRLACSRIFRSMIKDKEAFRDSLQPLFEHPWDRLIMAHGQCIDGDARQAVEYVLK